MRSNPDIEVCCISPELLGDMWPHVGPYLLKGQLEITPDMHAALLELLDYVLKAKVGRCHVWAVIDGGKKKVVAAMITEIIADDVDVPGRTARKVIWVSRMGGENIMSWGSVLSDTMAGYAKAEDAEAVRFYGRKALKRAYPRVHSVGEKDGVHLFERAV